MLARTGNQSGAELLLLPYPDLTPCGLLKGFSTNKTAILIAAPAMVVPFVPRCGVAEGLPHTVHDAPGYVDDSLPAVLPIRRRTPVRPVGNCVVLCEHYHRKLCPAIRPQPPSPSGTDCHVKADDEPAELFINHAALTVPQWCLKENQLQNQRPPLMKSKHHRRGEEATSTTSMKRFRVDVPSPP